MTKFSKTMIVLLTFLLIIVSSGCNISELSSGFDNSEVEEAIKNEFNMIPIMPDAIEKKHDFRKKTGLMMIGSTYLTNHNFEEIRDYYDVQLKAHGWQFYIEEKMYGGGKDHGGKSVRYKKDDFVATMQYAGEKADYGWTYAFSMSWGMRYE